MLSFFICDAAQAYIGPGAGFAFITSFFVLFASIAVAIVLLLTAPLRLLIRALRRRGVKKGKYGRVVILGLDGLDPGLAGEMMDAGELPNFKKLAGEGSFSPLKTSNPAMSPVAWSSFMTGVTAARHNIYDFLTPDRKSYYPKLSSSEVLPPARSIRIGSFNIPLGKPVIRLMRKSRPFWNILSDHGIFSSILRVPITFPAEPFRGHLLSAMCVPDLLGTQGEFTLFTSMKNAGEIYEGGRTEIVDIRNNGFSTHIKGPPNSLRQNGGVMTAPMTVFVDRGAKTAEIEIAGEKVTATLGRHTGWVSIPFRAGPGVTVSGICRFFLNSVEPELNLYMSPINIDPNNPALPISHPFIFSMYLAKNQGPYATLGLAEDTWALNERVLDEAAFLEQTYLNHEERERMFFHSLDRVRSGVVACVFDTTDRIQHMFWRYHERCEHQPLDDYEKYKDTIRDLYRRMDGLLERTRKKLGPKDALIVMSDHGFKAFRRGVDLNAWLEKEGYLHRKPDAAGENFLKDVDWSRTKAYALGLSGIFINLEGREGQGIVDKKEAPALAREIASRLEGLRDEECGETAVVKVHIACEIMNGPYIGNSPELLVGYNVGYRNSWDCAVGRIGGSIFENNTKSWSGDHCIEPEYVPGVLFTNLALDGGNGAPRMIDIAPSVLSLFNIKPPSNMEGKPVFRV